MNFNIIENNKIFTVVILDSNFLLVPIQLNIDIYEEIKYIIQEDFIYLIPNEVIEELQKKDKREHNRKFTLNLNNALRLLEQYIKNNPKKFIKININADINDRIQDIDNLLLNYALFLKQKAYKVFIATNDKIFKKKLKSHKLNIIFIRQSKKLDIF